MSLSAITRDFTIYNPSAKVEMGFDRFSTQSSCREKAKKQELFCPHCLLSKNELIPVSFRSGGDLKRDHFFHLKGATECVGYNPITEKHINAQSWIAECLQKKYPLSVIYKEFVLKTNQLNSRPDILMISEYGLHTAFEIQISRITVHEVAQRTKNLLQIGCNEVVWVFTNQSSCLEILQRLSLMGQKQSLIEFNDDLSIKSISLSDTLTVKQKLISGFRKAAKAKTTKNKTWLYNFLLFAKREYSVFLLFAFSELRKEIIKFELSLCNENQKLIKELNGSSKPFRHLVNKKIYLALDVSTEAPLNMMWFKDVESDKCITLPLRLLEAI